MKNHPYEKLKYSLDNLSQLLSYYLPTEALNTHPLDFYSTRLQPLFSCLEQIIHETKTELEIQKEENNRIKLALKERALKVGIEFTLASFQNLALEQEYLRNFEERIFVVENRLELEIKDMILEINSVKSMLNEQNMEYNNNVSLASHKQILEIYNEYRARKREMEKMRMCYVKSVMNSYRLLKLKELDNDDKMIIDDYTEVKIDVLCQKNNEMLEIIEERRKYVNELLKQIEDLRDVLYFHEISDEEICNEINDENIMLLENLKNRMKDIENQHFETIFQQTKMKLYEICMVFEMETVEFKKTRENLAIMKKIIHELSLKKDKFVELQSIISKRNELKARMINFEKSASDPKRLFKSSFQLIDEEKFRKTAYPTLLNAESRLMKNIDEYEAQYGEFIYKGAVYKKYLQNEIANRIINKNVFIMNKNETPKKCKK